MDTKLTAALEAFAKEWTNGRSPMSQTDIDFMHKVFDGHNLHMKAIRTILRHDKDPNVEISRDAWALWRSFNDLSYTFYGNYSKYYDWKAKLTERWRQTYDNLVCAVKNGVHYDQSAHLIYRETDPITLHDVELGQFRILIDPWRRVTILALQPKRPLDGSSFNHPHVADGRLCFGEASAAANAAIERADFLSIFDLATAVLNEFGHNPYKHIDDWKRLAVRCQNCNDRVTERVQCPQCERQVCENCLSRCNQCERDGCAACIHNCSNCDNAICENCAFTCERCDNIICGNCSLTCNGCHNTVCENCAGACSCGNHFCIRCLRGLARCHICGDYLCAECKDECVHCGQTLCPNCDCDCEASQEPTDAPNNTQETTTPPQAEPVTVHPVTPAVSQERVDLDQYTPEWIADMRRHLEQTLAQIQAENSQPGTPNPVTPEMPF
ncbi:MAG: hypothetical protein LLF76_02600 [Planctomycetaceae bacterium]|nr:hypothetical protein [Planctomycetaceae bacterium]